jgi:subtilase family serine protease
MQRSPRRTMVHSLCLAAIGLSLTPLAQAQTASSAPLMVTAPVDEAKMVPLLGNVRAQAKAANDRGAVKGDLKLEHILLQLKRPAAREAALTELIEQQYQPGSPLFHHWLTAEQLGDTYGPNPRDIAAVTAWLEKNGFQVNSVSKSGLVIDFSGTASQVA